MDFSMSLNNLKKIMAVATVFTISACLVPESAQAGLGRPSGNSGNLTNFEFDLIPVQDQAPENMLGVFPGAIQNFFIEGTFVPRLIPRLCENKTDCTIESGTLTITKLTTSNNQVNGKVITTNPNGEASELIVVSAGERKSISLNQLQEVLNKRPDARINLFKNDGHINDILMYNVTFDGTSLAPELIWFIESNDLNLINDLSGLTRFNKTLGIFPNDINPSNPSLTGGEFTLTLVPEPTATASLLGVGALGAVSLLKRHKRLKKLI